jgi:cation diffusion facilitator CzcD-associated flavoprotein CzcO
LEDSYDLIIVGAGIGGVVALHYARQAGLNAIVLEKASVAGGLWAQLPAWQDIQQPCLDWTVDGLPIAGEQQPHIHQNILAWIDRFDLASGIELDTPVLSAEHVDGNWVVDTPNQVIHSPHLLAATGVQNTPVIPGITRTNQAVSEYHSSALHAPEVLRNREVVVVGGGASAYDLIELALIHDAKSIRWVCRSAKWMAPSGKPKNIAGSIRWLGALQMQGMSPRAISQQVHDDLTARYQRYGIKDLIPGTPFNFDIHQLIPGRRQMIQSFNEIDYHCAEQSRRTRSNYLTNTASMPRSFCGVPVTTWISPCSEARISAKSGAPLISWIAAPASLCPWQNLTCTFWHLVLQMGSVRSPGLMPMLRGQS